MRRFLLFALLGLLMAGNAWAANVYVDAANGSGVEDGTAEFPFNTIQEGINAAVAGDIVSVASGIYHGDISLKDQVKVISQGGPKVTFIDGMGAGYAVRQPYTLQANTHIEGFNISGSNILISATNRVDFWAPISVVVDNCILKDAGLGIAMDPNADVTVSRTLFYFMTTAVNGWFYGTATLKNVTMDFLTRPFIMYNIYAYLYNTSINHAYSIFNVWGRWGMGNVYGSNNNYNSYTKLSSPNQSGWYPSINQASTTNYNPQFAMALPHGVDYHLKEGSPLIDAGVNVGLPFNGAAPDIGAYETDYVVSIPDMVGELAESYQEAPVEAFKNAGEQRRHALSNKFKAVLEKLEALDEEMTNEEKITIYSECLNKLRNDILAKADGFYGGHPNNDWIVTKEEQDRLYPEIMDLVNSIEAEINALSAL